MSSTAMHKVAIDPLRADSFGPFQPGVRSLNKTTFEEYVTVERCDRDKLVGLRIPVGVPCCEFRTVLACRASRGGLMWVARDSVIAVRLSFGLVRHTATLPIPTARPLESNALMTSRLSYRLQPAESLAGDSMMPLLSHCRMVTAATRRPIC